MLLAGFIAFPLLSGLVAPLVPRQVEDAVGAEMIKDTATKGAFCNAPAGREALQSLVDNLAAHADAPGFKVYVNEQAEMNAFAAPGGHVVLYLPIITAADSPDEVAGVLAHEMGHVVEAHPTEGLVESVGYGVFGMLTFGNARHKEIAKSLLTNHYSRSDELDADRAGVELLNAAGIDSRGLFGFFERIKTAGDDIPGAVEFLSTHPSGEARRANLEEHVAAGHPALTEEQWTALRSICEETGIAKPIEAAGN